MIFAGVFGMVVVLAQSPAPAAPGAPELDQPHQRREAIQREWRENRPNPLCPDNLELDIRTLQLTKVPATPFALASAERDASRPPAQHPCIAPAGR
jgi:hypothetical protein